MRSKLSSVVVSAVLSSDAIVAQAETVGGSGED